MRATDSNPLQLETYQPPAAVRCSRQQQAAASKPVPTTMAPPQREPLSLLAAAALVTVSLIGFANIYTYSNPDSFLGLALAAQGAHTVEVMICYAVDGAAVILCGLLVLLCQSLPFVANFKLSTKWWLVLGGQVLSVLTSLLSVFWPTFKMITTSRALHGVAESVYMIYSLILLVELSPRKHLALGIASLTAGMTAGDSVGPVAGAVMFDATGIQGAFTLQAAINAFALVVSALMIPLWLLSPQQSKEQLLQAQPHSSALPTHETQLQLQHSSSASSLTGSMASSGHAEQQRSSQTSVTAVCRDLAVGSDQQQKTAGAGAAAQAANTGSCPASKAAAAADAATSSLVIAQADQNTSTCDSCITGTQSASDSTCTASSKARLQYPACPQQAAYLQEQQQQQQLPRLDLAAVATVLRDPIIFSQCLLLLLEQAVRSSLTVVLPAAMGTRQLVVGMVYLANVVGSVSSPFLLDAYLSRRGTRCPTHRLATWTCLIMGASCCAVVPLAKVLPALVITLVVAGSAQAAVEALTYIHIAKRLDCLQRSTAVHVSMAMYILAQTTGGAIGSLLGSALLQQPWVVQVAAQAAVCGAAGLYGVALGVVNHRGWCCKDAFSLPVDHGMSDAAAPAVADARSRHVQDRQ